MPQAVSTHRYESCPTYSLEDGEGSTRTISENADGRCYAKEGTGIDGSGREWTGKTQVLTSHTSRNNNL